MTSGTSAAENEGPTTLPVAGAPDSDPPRVRYREWLPFLGLADASYWNAELVNDDDDL